MTPDRRARLDVWTISALVGAVAAAGAAIAVLGAGPVLTAVLGTATACVLFAGGGRGQ